MSDTATPGPWLIKLMFLVCPQIQFYIDISEGFLRYKADSLLRQLFDQKYRQTANSINHCFSLCIMTQG
jgi:hypothetical protein